MSGQGEGSSPVLSLLAADLGDPIDGRLNSDDREDTDMYRVLFPEGQLECVRYDRTDHGVDLYDEDDRVVAFVPYENLHAIIDEEGFDDDEAEPSVI